MSPPNIEHHYERGANAGSWTSVRAMKRIGSNPYANYFSANEACVFELFLMFAIRKNYLADYV